MQGPYKRYRIEGGAFGRSADALARALPASRPRPAAEAGERRSSWPGSNGAGEPQDGRPASHLSRLQGELHGLKDAIAMTKREIASLQRSATGRGGMHRAASELDAVSDATERATTTILGAVEEIESAANMLRAAGLETGRSDYTGIILDRVVVLYEACNFQDLTGQRIEKVVGTLKFVEERVETMIAAWGTPPASSREETDPAEEASGRGLVHGPSLPGDDHVSQTDIDAYFG